jgi:2-hydroxychromene-2-carboxylate isomerase
MEHVDFWFDPSCPFTWRTSRWLLEVAGRREVDVTWRPMSLAVLNADKELPEEYREPMRQGTRMLRVLAAAQESGEQDALIRLYTALGTRRHEHGKDYGDDTLRDALAEVGLPESLAEAADAERYDEVVRASHDEGQRRAATEVGSPVVSVDGGRGFFGPVVVPVPTGEEADRLYEAVRLLSSVPAFSELKGARGSF